MLRRLKKYAIVFVVAVVALFAGSQLIRPARTNPPTDSSRTFKVREGADPALIAVIERSCGDCHSNETEWSRYTTVAPVSWLITRGVTEGRKAVNFSEWGSYSLQKQRELLAASCKDARKGTMPGAVFLWVRPDARLSSGDAETICAASSRQTARAAR